MNFDFSDDEKMVRDEAQRYLRNQCDMKVVRQVLEGEAAYSQEVWQGISEMGLLGTAIPEAYGGVGAGYPTLCLVAEQIGRSLAPIPFSSSIYLAAEALLAFGTEEQKQSWLPKLASGEVIGTVADVEQRKVLTADSIEVSVQSGKMTGKKLIVADGGIADIAIVLARSGPDSLGLYLVDLGDASVTKTPIDAVDPTRNTVTLEFANTPVTALSAGDGWQQLQTIYTRAAVLMAFEQLGGAAAALDMAVAYAKERFAFGRPIGSFQALKHMMADMYVALKLAESNCYYAAWALDTNSDDLDLAAATARVSATQAFQLCSRDNIQVHGGMGFTWEFDCHLFYRRSNYLTLALGGLSSWEEKLVAALPSAKQANSGQAA
ncbi:MAG: acyl-CoA dehydrogenase family protein [Pseudomonadales bacterium]